MISIRALGSTRNTSVFLASLLKGDQYRDLDRYGQMGVDALSSVTPVDSGETATSWRYIVQPRRGGVTIVWTNSHVNQGANIALLIQYGHGTGTGGYVAGYDYINPAIRPIFDQISQNVWEKVIRG